MFLNFAIRVCRMILRGYKLVIVKFLQNFSPRSVECVLICTCAPNVPFWATCGQNTSVGCMLRCQHSSPQQWRWKTISKFCNPIMKAHNAALHVQDLFCTALTNWFDSGVVSIEQFHDSYHHDILLILQQQIGWIHLFMGHWSSKWEALHDIFHPQKTTSTWTATMIETGLQAMIQLVWEQHNGDVHGKSESEQKQKLAHSCFRWFKISNYITSLQPEINQVLLLPAPQRRSVSRLPKVWHSRVCAQD